MSGEEAALASAEAQQQQNGVKLTAAQKKKLKAKQRKQNRKAERCGTPAVIGGMDPVRSRGQSKFQTFS